MNKSAIHGYCLIFLDDMPEIDVSKGERLAEEIPENVKNTTHHYFRNWLGVLCAVPRALAGTLYLYGYHEDRANNANTAYTPARMSEYRLNRKRQHAIEEPDGRTAELMMHIDWLQERFDFVLKDAKECMHNNYAGFDEDTYEEDMRSE